MKKNSKIAALGLAAGLTAGGAAGLFVTVPGVSGAQTTDTTVEVPSDGTTGTDADRPDPGQHVADALAPLVSDGTLTQEQADAVVAALEAARPAGGPGMGHGRGGPGRGLDAAATALGLSEDDVRSAVRDGQTLAEVAQAQGVDPQTVIDAMVAEARTHLDEEVASGEHTQEEADQKLADITSRITEMVNDGMPERGPGPRGPMGADDGATEGD